MAVNDIVMSAAGGSAAATYIEDVFSTYLYTGNGSTQTITNGIDLSGKGGMVWGKVRSVAQGHIISDTVTGKQKGLTTNSTSAQYIDLQAITSFNSNGFTVGTTGEYNLNGASIASWTFREQPKFFDIVTYTGNGVSGRTISHNLGSTPGCVIVKRTDSTGAWVVRHVASGGINLLLNTTVAGDDPTTYANGNVSGFSSTTFTVSSGTTINAVNANGGTYVAYLFAHNAGGFGLTGNDNVISCGSFTTDASGNATVSLGYEPQWIMAKASSTTSDWKMLDIMRGASNTTTTGQSPLLFANTTNATITASGRYPTATGFYWTDLPSTSFIYIAIRRPMKTPTTGTSVFAPVLGTGGTTGIPTSFTVDSSWVGYKPGGFTRFAEVTARLIGPYYVGTSSANTESYNASIEYAKQTGFGSSYYTSDMIGWEFKRAPGFFDVVCYTGTGVARTINHNLGVVPELLIVKSRSQAIDWTGWTSYATPQQNQYQISLNTAGTWGTAGDKIWGATTTGTPNMTTSLFSLGDYIGVNNPSSTYVAYLFASCPGVSKVGSYTGNGSSQTINCGFAAGARFIMVKRTDSTGDWKVIDSARGIVSGNDPTLALNSTAAEVTGTDCIDPDNSGFIVNQETTNNLNVSSATYIYLAIA